MARHLSEQDLENLFRENLAPVELSPDIAHAIRLRVREHVQATLQPPAHALLAGPASDLPADLAMGTPRDSATTRRTGDRLAEWFAGLRLAPSLAFMAATAAILVVGLLLMPRLLSDFRTPAQPPSAGQPEQLPLVASEQTVSVPVIISGGDAQIQRLSGSTESFAGAAATEIAAGETLLTGRGAATVTWSSGQVSHVDAESEISLTSLVEGNGGLDVTVNQRAGSIQYRLDTQSARFNIETAQGLIRADQAEFTLFTSEDDELLLTVQSGSVALTPVIGDTAVIGVGQEASVRSGQAPIIRNSPDGNGGDTESPAIVEPIPSPSASTETSMPAQPTATSDRGEVPEHHEDPATPTALPTVLAGDTSVQDAAGVAVPETFVGTAVPVGTTPAPGPDADSRVQPTATPTAAPSNTATPTRTPTQHPSTTPTPLEPSTATATAPPPATDVVQVTRVSTERPTAVSPLSPVATATPLPAATSTPSPMPSATSSPTPTFSATATNTLTPTHTPVPTSTYTPTPDNRAPTVRSETGLVLNEDSSITIPVLGNDSDPDGDAIFIVAVENGRYGQTVNNQDNTVSYVPSDDFNGTDSFRYFVSDGIATATGAVSVTVRAVNDPPTFQLTTTQVTVTQDSGLVDVEGLLVGVQAGPADEGDQALRAVVEVDNPALFAEEPSISLETGTLAFTPAQDLHGTAVASITVVDSGGAVSAAQAVTITIHAVNGAPIARPDRFSTDADRGLMGDLLADNSSGADLDPDGDALAVVSVNGTPVTRPEEGKPTEISLPSGAELTIWPTGQFEYDARFLFESGGQDSFSYTIADDTGATATTSVEVIINPPVTQ